jgi:hypothetical protein
MKITEERLHFCPVESINITLSPSLCPDFDLFGANAHPDAHEGNNTTTYYNNKKVI